MVCMRLRGSRLVASLKSPRPVPSLKWELADDVEVTPNVDQEQCDFSVELLHGLGVVNVDIVSWTY